MYFTLGTIHVAGGQAPAHHERRRNRTRAATTGRTPPTAEN